MIWKSLKGMTYALGFAAFGVWAIQNGAPVLPTTGLVFLAGGAAMVGEVKEVEVANVVTLTFKRNGNEEPEPEPVEDD